MLILPDNFKVKISHATSFVCRISKKERHITYIVKERARENIENEIARVKE